MYQTIQNNCSKNLTDTVWGNILQKCHHNVAPLQTYSSFRIVPNDHWNDNKGEKELANVFHRKSTTMGEVRIKNREKYESEVEIFDSSNVVRCLLVARHTWPVDD